MSPRKHRVSSHDLSRSTIQQSVLNLVNCIVGAGVLGYPYCFKSSGYMLATVIMLVCLVACRFSYQLMLYCTQLTSRRTFEDMAEQATGQLGKLTITLCVAALNLGSIVAYLNILADVLSSVAGTIIPPGAEPSRSVFLAGVTLFGALPVALIVRDHHVMASFSMASVGFIVLFACVIVLFACLPTLPYVAAAHGEIRMWRMDGLLVAFPVMAYSFTAHPYYLGIFTSMQKPTQAGMLHVTDTSLALAGGLYWLVGLAGYVTFRSRTAGDLLRNFGAANVVGLRGAYERAVKLCYGLSILGSVPLVILPFYNIVLPWVGLESSHRPAAGMHDTRMKSRQSDDEEEVAASTHSHSPSPLGLQGSTSRSGRISDDPVMRAGPHALGLSGSGAVKRGHTSSAVQHAALEQPLPPALEALGEGQATDIVDLRLQHDGHQEEIAGSLSQHVLVVSIVLGMAMASAIWVPNVEFIFGLTGATASVIISYIMPALIFIRLVAQSPELTATSIAFTNTKVDPAGGGGGAAAAAAAAGKTDTSNAVEMSSVWVWRRRMALALLVFGLVSGIACTDAILSAVKEEAVVVQLAQQLAAHEAVVVETTRAQTKAQEAVAAVSVVQTASAQLGLAQANASSSLGKLQRAADVLSGLQQDANAPPHNVWDLRGFIKDVSRSATDHKVLSSVEAVLLSVTQDVAQTRASVAAVLGQLDDAIAQLRSSAAMLTNSSSSPGAATTATSVMPGGSRVADLATELGKALGGYSSSVTQNVTAGKSLQQVRVNAASALAALDQTLNILHTVQNAVRSTKQTHHHDKAQLTQAAVAAMQAALNATATSNLAMRLTADALMHSASQETDELLSILTQVASNLQRSRLHGSTAASVTRVGQEAAFTPSPSPSPSTSPSATSSSPHTGSMSVNSTTTTTSSSSLAVSSKQHAPYPSPLSPWGRGGPAAAPANSGGPPPRPAGGEGAVQQGLPKHSSANSSGVGGSGGQGQTGATASSTASSTDTAASTTAKQKAQALKKVIADLKDLVGSTGNTSSLPAAASSSREEVGGQSTLEGGGGASSAGEGFRGFPGNATASRSPPQPPRLAAGSAGSQAQGSTTVPSSSQPVDAAASSQGVNSSSSSTAGGGQGQGVEGEVDVAAMALVLKDAVALTADTQSTVIQEIQNTLGKADSKVQERVVGILKDMTGSSVGKVASEPTAAAQPPAGQAALPKPGRAHAGPAAGGVGDQAGLSIRQAEQQQGKEEEQVVGPTVIVDTQGRLHQQDDADNVSGPVVKQSPQGLGAGVATSSNASTPTASLPGVGGSVGVTQKVNRKFGAGADSS